MPQKHEAGFTIVELVITIIVFAFVAAAIAELFLTIENVQRDSAYLQVATSAAQNEVESLRNNNYNELTDGQNLTFTSSLPSSLPGPKSGTVAISEPTTGIKRVDVTVSYTIGTQKENVELSSLIGVIGIAQ